MILVIDNYDSFTYNLVQAVGALGGDLKVFRNDKISVEEAAELKPERVIISPGPCTPLEAGVSCEMIRHFAGKVPVLGVCLGHQSIAHAFGGEVIRAELPVHGKTSMIEHDGLGVLKGVENPFVATRYHSLLVREESLPECFIPSAWTQEERILMGIRHRDFPLEGLQFHPESFLTVAGEKILKHFL
ncbi:MAG: aminodeoxychorismate/anthranilate synthase component II, partial [Planctomycetes bacterium]|nr:aminodeoxychorismate/anthranilate synthase component II [Planctomycetota bacterium]